MLIYGENVRSQPLYYPEFHHYLQAKEGVAVSKIGFQRDSTASRLFVTFHFRKGGEAVHRTVIFSRDAIKEIQGYPAASYNDQEKPVIRLEGAREWYDNEGRFFSRFDDANYVLSSGMVIPYKAIAGISSFLGTNLIILRLRDKPVWIVSTPEDPTNAVVELPSDFQGYPQRAYATTNSLIIFATWGPMNSKHVVKCLVYGKGKSSNGYELWEEIPLPWAGRVYDFNVKTAIALIGGTGEAGGCFRFNIKSKHRFWMDFTPTDHVLFLNDDVIRTLNGALKE